VGDEETGVAACSLVGMAVCSSPLMVQKQKYNNYIINNK
jgi:hypothetical protein